jgi:hypothetical protein
MGLLTATPPPFAPEQTMDLPYFERIRRLAVHWVDHGAGLPKFVMFIYIFKMAAFATGGAALATLTSGLDPLHPAGWFDAPIVWQKLVCWVMLVEVLGVGGAWGPLCGHFKPMTGGYRYWLRPGTIRLPPWPSRVPLTAGDAREPVDIALYALVIIGLLLAIVLPGTQHGAVAHAPGVVAGSKGLVSRAVLILTIAVFVLLGLRDKTIFLAGRGEQWLPALIFFAFYPTFADMVVAAKLLIVCIWLGAGVSKMNPHFEMVIPPMVSNTPWLPLKWVKRLHYRRVPDDLRPSRFAANLSHIGGAIGELIPPWVLLFSHNPTVTTIAVVFMIGYHVFITSTFPLAVPLEWNLMFIYLTAFLFLGYPAYGGYGVGELPVGLLALTLAGLLVWPILGELRPDLVSFLPSLRQYSGNWATTMWAFAPGAEAKLDTHLVKAAPLQCTQLAEMFDPDSGVLMLHQYLAWRAMHSQGRGLHSLMLQHLGPEIDRYDLREGEIVGNLVVGWNFGCGHLHAQAMQEAVQRRCHFAPGEVIVVFAESEPILSGRQAYWVHDLGVGIVERGFWRVRDAVAEQPWLPNGPIATEVSWRWEGYVRVADGPARSGRPGPAGPGSTEPTGTTGAGQPGLASGHGAGTTGPGPVVTA